MRFMLIIGITGGSGCGKTTVSDMFRKSGIEVIDCDDLAHRVTEPGEPALAELAEVFGKDILLDNGCLDRKKLGKIVFSEQKKLKLLNAVVHKYIIHEIKHIIENAAEDIIAIDGAVLIESGVSELCDYMLSVLAEREVRIERICRRDNITRQTALNRIGSQSTDAYYISHSDYVIHNNGDIDKLTADVNNIILKLRNMC